MKTLVYYVLCIVDCMSINNKAYRHVRGLFDARLRSFMSFYVPNSNTAHVPQVNTSRGLMHLVNGTTRKEKSMTSHSMGRIPSSHFITLLLLIYFVIGDNGDILPASSSYKYKKTGDEAGDGKRRKHDDAECKNITEKVLTAISSLLALYFECKRATHTAASLQNLKRLVKVVQVKFLLVWELIQVMVTDN